MVWDEGEWDPCSSGTITEKSLSLSFCLSLSLCLSHTSKRRQTENPCYLLPLLCAVKATRRRIKWHLLIDVKHCFLTTFAHSREKFALLSKSFPHSTSGFSSVLLTCLIASEVISGLIWTFFHTLGSFIPCCSIVSGTFSSTKNVVNL